MQNNHEIDMINGPLTGKIIKFALPLMLAGILQLLYNAADIVVVGRFAGSRALAAVSSTTSLINLIVNLFAGLSIGTSVALARYLGAQNHKEASETVHTSIALSLIFGIVLAIVGIIIAKPVLIAMDSPEDVLPMSVTYLKIYFLGSPANLLYNYGSAIMRTSGDTKRPLYFLTFSGIVNVILNLVLVICFGMDVAGVAIATIVSQYISAALVFVTLMRNNGSCRLIIKNIRIIPKKLGQLMYLGIPASIQGLMFSLSNIIIQSSINSFGALAIAGNGAASSIEGFVYTAMNSFGVAAQVFSGQNIGAGKIRRVNKVLVNCLFMSITSWAALCVTFAIFKIQLLSIYLPNDAEAITYGIQRMSVVMYSYFLCGTMEIVVGILRAMGKSIFPAAVSIVCICLLRIVWIFTVFAKVHTFKCLFLSYPITWLAAQSIFYVFYAITYRKMLKQSEQLSEAEQS